MEYMKITADSLSPFCSVIGASLYNPYPRIKDCKLVLSDTDVVKLGEYVIFEDGRYFGCDEKTFKEKYEGIAKEKHGEVERKRV